MANKLAMNVSKTNIVDFSKNCSHATWVLPMNNLNMIPVPRIKFLGLTVDEKFEWLGHIEELSNKLKSLCFLLKCAKNYLPTETLLLIYYGYFHSRLSYGVMHWGNSKNHDLIFRLQKRAIRFIFNKNTRDSCRPLFKNSKIMSFPSIYMYQTILFVKQNIYQFYKNNTTHNHKLFTSLRIFK